MDLVENYETNTSKQQVIKDYAISGSMNKTRWKMKEIGFDLELKDISNIIKSQPQDELHKIVSGFHRAKSPKKYSDIW